MKQLAVKGLRMLFKTGVLKPFRKQILRQVYYKHPKIISIELTNKCNSKCVMCPNKDLKRPFGYMKYSLWKKIVDDLSQYRLKIFNPVFQGELFLHPGWERYLKYSREKINAKQTFLNTNGALLTEKNSKKLIPLITDIRFDVDATTKDVYEKIRVGLKFERVMKNYLRFIDLNKGRVKVHVTFIKQKYNEHQAEDFIMKWQHIVDRVDVCDVSTYRGYVPKSMLIKSSPRPPPTLPCIVLFDTMMITWEGKVAYCCYDADCEYPLGNLKENTVKEIWTGARYAVYRELHIEKDLNDLPMCMNCNMKSDKLLWSGLF